MHTSKEVTNWLAEQTDQHQPTLRALRSIILACMPGAHEFIYHSALCYQAPSVKFFPIIYIGTYANHINLGFYHGASLDDPNHLLVGTGKQMRHIKIDSFEDAKKPAVADLLKQSWFNASQLHK